MEEDQSLAELVRSFGMTRKYSGYRCLICALELIREDPECLLLPTKGIYPVVARRCGLTVGGVDSALRTAVGVCCRKEPERMARLGADPEGTLTVKQFLCLLMELDRAQREAR